MLALVPELASRLVPLERLEHKERPRQTGIVPLDELLGGGWPHGALSELAGPRSSGRTAIVLASLGRALARGEAAALVDTGGRDGALDPRTAAAAGVPLSALLWIRCVAGHALKAADLVVAAGGFGVVALDLCDARLRVPDAAWIRLAHRAREQGTTVLIASNVRRVGTFARVAVELGRAMPSFLSDGPALFSDIHARAELGRAPSMRAANDSQGERRGTRACASLVFTCHS